ncbi:group II intron maturase-specific domain-containing protein [Bacillus mycoides]|nr:MULTISPECIES: group II intron maturase-specific domain-containing protein [Bacillus cereus group]MDI6531891.1 group II intron maturase-specific domain-containing protein [Bacillus mycoides]MED1057457.1 group II intron maturase-specific domain-containing protein [Bacillus mycoides]WJE59920.1 group II intron maturase-specific domain-containing protein [Bacillus mycoides]WJE65852.1 group II intron maturase-specific domain-containing protein [Bacillus mycoides]WJE78269.1 group II intron maturas
MVKGLNRILQGFKNYYSLSSIGQKWLGKIDWYVLERLNLFWIRKETWSYQGLDEENNIHTRESRKLEQTES